MDLHQRPLEFRLAGLFPRFALYAVLSFWLCRLCTCLLRDDWAKWGEPDKIAGNAVFTGAFLTWWFIVKFRWRIRVDELGVTRRRFICWDRWPWDAFQSGVIRKSSPFSYEWPGKRPWWNANLSFTFVEPEHREILANVTRRFWTPRTEEPPAPPSEMTIRWGGLRRNQVQGRRPKANITRPIRGLPSFLNGCIILIG